jgi:hypothetical protein
MVNIPKPNPEMVARIKAEREAMKQVPTFEQQVQMAKEMIRNGESWMGCVQDPAMRQRIQEAL